MTPSNVTGRTGWAALLAEPGGPEGINDRVLRIARKQATEPLTGSVEVVIAGADEALAAVAALRGAADCREFLVGIEPVVSSIGRQLEVFPEGIADRAVLAMFCLVAISETVGFPLERPSVNLERRFTRFVVSKTFSKQDKVTVALLSLDLGRLDDVPLLVGKGGPPQPAAAGADPVSLVKILAAAFKSRAGSKDVEPAWHAFLLGFPSALEAEKAEWRHLLLAARIVLGKLGSTPMGDVAETLHRRIVAFTAEKSA